MPFFILREDIVTLEQIQGNKAGEKHRDALQNPAARRDALQVGFLL
jgi:hypothetical protein